MEWGLEFWPSPKLVQRVVCAAGWTFVHSLWQGILLAAVVWVAGSTICWRWPRVQFRLCGAALACAALAALSTFTCLLACQRPAVPLWAAVGAIPLPQLPCEVVPSIEFVLGIWLVVAIYHVFRIGVALNAQRLALIRAIAAPKWLNDMCLGLLAKMRMDHTPIIAICAEIESPMAAGVVRPWIGLPSESLKVLSDEHLETVLVHELEHVRNNDVAVNILAQLILSVMWYHPCIRWIVRQMNLEREYACDQAALAFHADPLLYAKALVALESHRAKVGRHAVPFFSPSIKTRVQRILGKPSGVTGRTLQLLELVIWILLSLFGLMLAVVYTTVNSPPG